MPLLRDYAAACGPYLTAAPENADVAIRAVTADSREVTEGALFVAVPGSREDGARFIPDAIAAGAAAVVCEGEGPPLPLPTVRVSCAYSALGRMAEFHFDYPGRNLTVAAVTGTNGKTTIGWLMRHVLSQCGRRCGLIGSIGTAVGNGPLQPAKHTTPTPMRFQQRLADIVADTCTHATLEVSSHALHQRRIGSLACRTAVFTNLTRDHLDYHQTTERYFEAKSRLFLENLDPDGDALVNCDDPFGRRLAETLRRAAIRCTGYGFADSAEYHPAGYVTDLNGTQLLLREPGGAEYRVTSRLAGRFNGANLMATWAAARALGCEPEPLAAAIASFPGVPGRLERVGGPDGPTVLVDYAHTPDALGNVLATLAPLRRRELVVVFGCGGDRDRSKRPEMGAIAAHWADRVWVTTDNPRTENPDRILNDIAAGIPSGTRFRVVADRREAIRQAIREADDADTVLLAGKGHEDYQEIGETRHHFDDREEAAAALADRCAGTAGESARRRKG